MPPDVNDALRRPLRDLRISVTDRCNFRCTYCMPKEIFGRDFAFLPPQALLSFEEITRLARIFVALGVEKIRITGGEPLVRRDIEKLVSMLAALPGLADLTMTTNGSLLAAKARALAGAGLRRISVSLDSLDDSVFRGMNDVDFPVKSVLNGIDAARAAGLSPIKITVVVKRGANEDTLVDRRRKSLPASTMSSRSNPWTPTIVVRSRFATGTATALARSASSRRSHNPSAGTARAPDCHPMASSSRVSSQARVTICARSCARIRLTMR
jgi:Radical SAM superfamily